MQEHECVKLFDEQLSSLSEPLSTLAVENLSKVCEQESIDPANLDSETRQQLFKTLTCSDYVTQQCIRKPSLWIDLLESGDLHRAYEQNTLQEKFDRLLAEAADENAFNSLLRQQRHFEMMRIAWRDINQLAELNETLRDLSHLADAAISTTQHFHHQQLSKQFGIPVDEAGHEQHLIVIGMGKLGGYELNFSSDIDLIFAYPSQGNTQQGPRSVSNQEFFNKLGQGIIRSLDQMTVDGFVFRVDMRLRPFGNSGPLAIHFDALENYYTTHGREWERYAWIKARFITGEAADVDYLRQMLMPFVFRRYIDFSVFESLRDMKRMIAREVKQKRKENNIKLGAGGIREVEFLAQAFQLIRGGRDSELQDRRVQVILQKLVDKDLIPDYVQQELQAAYVFLRNTEHRLQEFNDQQTQVLPDSELGQQRLAYGMGFSDWPSFHQQLEDHRHKVHNHFEQIFTAPQQEDDQSQDHLPQDIWLDTLSEEGALSGFDTLGYDDPSEAFSLINRLRESHSFRKMSAEAHRRLDKVMPLLLGAVGNTDNPEATLKRTLSVIETICRRSAYLALLMENPMALSQLVRLCAASPWISQHLTRYPALLDELLDARVLYVPLERDKLIDELGQQLKAVPADDQEQRMNVMRYFKQSQLLRVAAADVTGHLPVMKVSDYLTWLAEAILHHVLESAWQDLVAKHGAPQCGGEDGLCGRGFAVIGYGKLGGIELGYGSDLDLVFIYGDKQAKQQTTGEKPVANEVFYTRLGQRIMHMLQTQMPSGVLYEVDMRLRPNGNSGLLTTSLSAYEGYQLNQAWTWEHQALTRARYIVGDELMHEAFEKTRTRVLAQPRDKAALKKEVVEMREKMRQALGKAGKGEFDVKQGKGGIADIEFIVQYLVLANAHEMPALLKWSDNIRILETAAEIGLISSEHQQQLTDAYRHLRIRTHRCALQGTKSTAPDSEFQPEREQVMNLWQYYLGKPVES